eukprot:5570408-Pyramimonas_sp.AAC.1
MLFHAGEGGNPPPKRDPWDPGLSGVLDALGRASSGPAGPPSAPCQALPADPKRSDGRWQKQQKPKRAP